MTDLVIKEAQDEKIVLCFQFVLLFGRPKVGQCIDGFSLPASCGLGG